MKPLKLISVVGARPNFVKIAPICAAMPLYAHSIRHLLVHTGQHYDFSMSQEFFDTLAIPEPDVHLAASSGSHAGQTAHIMVEFEKVCLAHKPDWVMVVGDVNSALAAALTAKKLGIAVAHLEAGLRSFDMTMPEELNRKVVDCIGDLLFTPSQDANDNLAKEGVDAGRIKLVGNIMIDTLLRELPRVEERRDHEKRGLASGQYIYLTLHRPSNVDKDETLVPLVAALKEIAVRMPVIFPAHPRTAAALERCGFRSGTFEGKGFTVINPVSYHESIGLAKNSALVITDSGGLQEETTCLGVPCLTVRPNTERPVTITHGTNRLTDATRLASDVFAILNNGCHTGMKAPFLWDGNTAGRVLAAFAALAA